jgi:hypothetical protein
MQARKQSLVLIQEYRGGGSHDALGGSTVPEVGSRPFRFPREHARGAADPIAIRSTISFVPISTVMGRSVLGRPSGGIPAPSSPLESPESVSTIADWLTSRKSR